MYILSLLVREFGGIKDRSFDFSRGMNLLTGDNESGKSTLISFIRFMLYGLPKRRAGESLSDGDRAFSWENGVADGSMKIEKDGKIYRIERREQSAGGRKLLTVYDEESGDPLPKGDAPGVFLLGIPAEVFDSTACLRQLRAGDLDSDGLSSAIENLLLSGDEAVNTEKAMKNLDKARTTLLHKNGHGGEIHRYGEEIGALRLRLDQLREDHRALLEAQERGTELKKCISEVSRALEKAEEEYASLSETEILTRFDALREEEARLSALEKELTDYEAAHQGGVAAPTLCRSLESASEQLDRDERNILRCEAELRIANEAPATSEWLTETADAVYSAGGKEAVLDRLAQSDRAYKKEKRLSLVFRTVGLSFLLLGIILALALQDPLFLLPSLVGALAFVGIAKEKRSRAIRKETDAFRKELRLDPSVEPETYVELALRERRTKEERVARITAAEAAVKDAKRHESEHRIEAEQLLLSIGKALTEITPQALRALSLSLTRESAERERLVSGVSLLSDSVERAKKALLPYSEPILRSRLPEGFDYKDPASLHAYEEKRDRLRASLSALREEHLTVERRISALAASAGDPEALLSEINDKSAEKRELEQKHRAILLAIEAITVAREGLKGRIGPQIRSDASRYLSILSDGKYDRLRLDESFTITTEENGRSHPSDAFSGGTRDAMYLSLRLALTDLFRGGGEPFPILLDEALAQLDDTRAEALLSLLLTRAQNGGQVLLFTCHTREKQMLAGTDTHFIGL